MIRDLHWGEDVGQWCTRNPNRSSQGLFLLCVVETGHRDERGANTSLEEAEQEAEDHDASVTFERRRAQCQDSPDKLVKSRTRSAAVCFSPSVLMRCEQCMRTYDDDETTLAGGDALRKSRSDSCQLGEQVRRGRWRPAYLGEVSQGCEADNVANAING